MTENHDLETLQRSHLADPQDRRLLAVYHAQLRRRFSAKTALCLETMPTWLSASSLEQDASAALLSERLAKSFDFLAMTPVKLGGSSCSLPLFCQRQSGLEVVLLPGNGEEVLKINKAGVLPFLAQSLPLLDFGLPRTRIEEAAAWRRLDPSDWPRELSPHFDPDLNSPDPKTIEDLFVRRSEILLKRKIPPSPSLGGRLLVCRPSDSLSDGAAAVASEGFFSDDNLPSWDSWILFVPEESEPRTFALSFLSDDLGPLIGFGPGYLICWISPDRIPAVQRGLDIHIEQCIRWTEDSPEVLARLVSAEGLLECS